MTTTGGTKQYERLLAIDVGRNKLLRSFYAGVETLHEAAASDAEIVAFALGLADEHDVPEAEMLAMVASSLSEEGELAWLDPRL